MTAIYFKQYVKQIQEKKKECSVQTFREEVVGFISYIGVDHIRVCNSLDEIYAVPFSKIVLIKVDEEQEGKPIRTLLDD